MYTHQISNTGITAKMNISKAFLLEGLPEEDQPLTPAVDAFNSNHALTKLTG